MFSFLKQTGGATGLELSDAVGIKELDQHSETSLAKFKKQEKKMWTCRGLETLRSVVLFLFGPHVAFLGPD